MSPLRAAGGTDPGQVRAANEDALWLGESVFAVADGMGGHLAGEVASSLALEPIQQLDGRVFPDAATAQSLLRSAVERANETVVDKATTEPDYRGMGTTLTAALFEGRRLHVAHVGDSRAYLLRDDRLQQLTQDHTLVQHLIDQGQITREEAAHHPQRSIITRAIGVGTDVDVDSLSLDLADGDQVLLCSDGLSGVVTDDEITAVLQEEADGEQAVAQLLSRANRAGGPDNITVVLLRFAAADAAPTTNGRVASASPPGERRVVVRTSGAATDDDWAQQLGRVGARDGRALDSPRRLAGWQRTAAIVLAIAVLAAVVIGGGRWLLSRSYYVGLDGNRVVIFQGVPARLGPVSLSWEHQETSLTVDDLPAFLVTAFRDGRSAADLADARRIVANARPSASGARPAPPATPSPPAETSP